MAGRATLRILCAALLFLFSQTVDAVTGKSGAREVCSLKAECQLCTAGDIDAIPECKNTGKVETFNCVTKENGAEVDSRQKDESCQRTRTEEDFLMVQFQVFCLFLGSFTYMTVKRQRLIYASGFDQRKEFPGLASSHYTTNTQYSRSVAGGGANNTLGLVSTAEERVPLAEDEESGIEVI
mmetsp:Transcript_16848/g.21976  ORF Transcript_16848/g.21976 Transcript_16848/m.21976 type:complete len:181 (-) Transcript_16848:400-942(-)